MHTTRLDIGGLRHGYRCGRYTPTAVVAEVLRRIEARGDDHVWIRRVPAGELHERAAQLPADRDLPLYGVPFAVKDNIDVAGMPTTAGCPDFAYWPDRNAPVVDRLLAAGALLVGKTNLDQFATGLTGTRSPYGAVQSVLGGGLIAGGSSSGSAVAVAAGLVGFALGTDTAGSGRVPAALNEVVGLKPTRGLLSTAGVVPACASLDCVSVFARDVADAGAVLAVASGYEPDDLWSRPAQPDHVAIAPPAVRLGVPDGELDFFGDAGQRDRYATARHAAAGLVAALRPIDLAPFLAAGDLLYEGPWVAERLAGLGDFLADHEESVLPVTRTVLARGRRFTATDAFAAAHRLQRLRATVEGVWREVDALLLPTIGTTFTLSEVDAEPIARNALLGRYTQFANLLDLAVVTVPNGRTAAGRPASVSFLGPAFSEPTLCRLAAAFTGEPVPSDVDGAGTGTVLAVVGHHLSGEPRNGELLERGARMVGPARTAPAYRLYRLPAPGTDGVPGLVRVAAGGVPIEVELWRLPEEAVGGFLDRVRAPLSIGRVRLADGRQVLGFLCEAYAVDPLAEDISASGGWRGYRSATTRI